MNKTITRTIRRELGGLAFGLAIGAAVALFATPSNADGGGPGRGHGSGSSRAGGFFISHVDFRSDGWVYYQVARADDPYAQRIRALNNASPRGRQLLQRNIWGGGLCGGCTAPSDYDYNRN